MAAGDIFKKRLKVDTSSIDNTITMIAWDTYSADNSFDDIYIDNFADATGIDGTVGDDGILSGNSTGVYSTAFEAAELTNLTQDISTSQINCSTWQDINSVAVTQTTPGDVTVSAIYHAVSFDNQVTYKVFKTTWQTVAYNNGGTWQYNNAGSLTNASTNSLAGAMTQSTAQSAYQWTKTNIEAMADADWNASGGWSASVTTWTWAHRDVTGTSYAADGTASKTANMTNYAAPSPNKVSVDVANTTYYAWYAFNVNVGTTDEQWYTGDNACPHWITYDFGSGNSYIINKFRYFNNHTNYPIKRWKIQGYVGSTPDTPTASDNADWVTLDDKSGADQTQISVAWSEYYSFNNTTPYRIYRLYITATYHASGGLGIREIQFLEASTATPTFTKATINYDTDHIPLSLISNSWEASVNDPVDAYCVLDVEPVDAITLNTDLLAYASIDNGSHYEQITLEAAPFREIGDHDYVRGDLTSITARTDKTIRIKVTSANSKALKLHAWAIGVRY